MRFQTPSRLASGARISRVSSARRWLLLGPQLARVPQPHQLLSQARHDQARIVRHCQQHLAQRLRLLGIESVRRGPVSWQAQLAQPRQTVSEPQRGRGQPRFVPGGLARQAVLARPVQRRGQRQIGVLRQCGDQFRGLDAAAERHIAAAELQQRACARHRASRLYRALLT